MGAGATKEASHGKGSQPSSSAAPQQTAAATAPSHPQTPQHIVVQTDTTAQAEQRGEDDLARVTVVPQKVQLTLEQFLGAAATGAKYVKRELIGKGAFGEAYIVERAADGKKLVAKLMDLRQMSPKDKRYAQTEILCLAHSEHFAIIQYVEHHVFDEDTVAIVMEFADHGDLYNNIKKGNLQLSEREAGIYFAQLLLALDHIHRRRMIHRDIKSANVFMTSTALLKLGDFGFSQQYDQTVSNPIATTFLGTPYYLAPEMWRGNRYGKKADMWAAGIVLFELLTTKRPFIAQNMPTLKEKVLSGVYQIPTSISREMQEIVTLVLAQDPNKRPSAQELLRLPLMQHYVALLKKHVDESPDIDAETRALVARNIEESQEGIRAMVADEQSTSEHFEGVVFKESDGGWKERYLLLNSGSLIMTLARGKEAAGGGDRSRKIPLDAIMSAVPVGNEPTGGKWVFAISTTTSSAILMGTTTCAERDEWVNRLLVALQMN